MDVLGAERIGHGYSILEDNHLYSETKGRGIHFEVCPYSSYVTESVGSDLTDHPAVRYRFC